MPVQTYAAHTCRMYPINAKFLYNEQYIVTGSEDNTAYVYGLVDGQVARKVELGCPVTQVEPAAGNDLGFYVILYRNQRVGLVDVSGDIIEPELPTVEERQRERMKSAMQTTLWELSNQIYQHLRVIGRYNMVGYGNLLDALQTTAQTDPGSRQLLAEIQERYEKKLAESYLQLPQLSNTRLDTSEPTRRRQERGISRAEVVCVESYRVESWPAYLPDET